MRRLITAITIMASIALAVPVQAVELEPGATFLDGGRCVEADGTPGMSGVDGQCVTAADYDLLFSREALSKVETLNPFDGDTTVAEQAGIVDDIPSERLLGIGVTVPFTFQQDLERWLQDSQLNWLW